MEAINKHQLGFPSQKLLHHGIVGDAIEGAGEHFRMHIEFGGLAPTSQDFLRGVNYFDALHRAEIHAGAIVDFLGGEDRAADDVINVGPVADLLASVPQMISGEMENHTHILHGFFCDLLLSQIRLHEFDTVSSMGAWILSSYPR